MSENKVSITNDVQTSIADYAKAAADLAKTRLTENENRLSDEIKWKLQCVRTPFPDCESLRTMGKVAVDRINELGDGRWTSKIQQLYGEYYKIVHCHACNYEFGVGVYTGELKEIFDEQEISQIKAHEEICKTGIFEY